MNRNGQRDRIASDREVAWRLGCCTENRIGDRERAAVRGGCRVLRFQRHPVRAAEEGRAQRGLALRLRLDKSRIVCCSRLIVWSVSLLFREQ